MAIFEVRWFRAFVIGAIAASVACSSSSSSPATPSAVPNRAAIAIVGLTVTVEPLTTTPVPGLVYRLSYQVQETAGRVGATLTSQRIVLSDGQTGDSAFKTSPHVLPNSAVSIVSTLSVYPASTPAAHATFSITYTDDGGQIGTVSAEADVSPLGT